jgi:hypothetical protein
MVWLFPSSIISTAQWFVSGISNVNNWSEFDGGVKNAYGYDNVQSIFTPFDAVDWFGLVQWAVVGDIGVYGAMYESRAGYVVRSGVGEFEEYVVGDAFGE